MQVMCAAPPSTSERHFQPEQLDYAIDLQGASRQKLESMLKMPYLTTTKACSVNNIYMQTMYEIKKAEYSAKYGFEVAEDIMFYTTSAPKARDLMKNNFNWREARTGELGTGVAFCLDPEYSNFISPSRCHKMAIIVVKVLKVKCCRGYSFMDFPPEDCDTVCDAKRQVFVKFHDHEFLPVHVAFFDRPDGTLNKYYPKEMNPQENKKRLVVKRMSVLDKMGC